MDTTVENHKNSLPSNNDETIRNRKKSTVINITEQKPHLIKYTSKNFEDQKNDTNDKSESQKVSIADPNEPKDRFFFVLIAVVLLGLVHQLPFSFFGIANEYWMYKFRNTTSNSTDAKDRSYLQTNFSALSGMIEAIPTIISNFLLTFVAHNIKAKTRVMVTLVVHTVTFSVHVLLININTDTWQEGFFYLTTVTIVIVRCTLSFGAAGQYSLLTKLPSKYLKGYLLGGGIANLFNSVMRLISVSLTPSATGSAMIYFGTATFFLLVSTIATLEVTHTSFFRHYTRFMVEEKKQRIQSVAEIKEVIKYIWSMILLNVFILAVPSGSISNLVVSEHHGEKGNVWAHQYFITVCSYFIPSLTNTIGRAIYNKLDWNWPMPAMFLLVIFYQIVNTTTIYLSNAWPRSHLPVLLKHDWEYAAAMALHGLAIGFITNMTNIKSIRMIPPEKTELTMLLLYFFNSVIQSAFSPLGMVAIRLI